MPVLDHPVHPSTMTGPEHRYGCWNREAFKSEYVHQSCIAYTTVKDRMSRECRYDLSLTDPACTDCKHRGDGEAYDASVRRLACTSP